MKRIEVGTQKPNFIGCWDIENKKLCNEIVFLKTIKIYLKREQLH